jgi:7-keto-8-aminopelargonate synthetase-like enzyme
MDGDVAPLKGIVELKERHGAWLLLDEAHAVGVLGSGAGGLAGQLGLADRIEIQMGTLGKALGVSGGYIAGSRALIDVLTNRARSFIFSTAPAPAVAAASRASLRIVASEEGDRLRARLRENLKSLASVLKLHPSQSAIIPIILGSGERAMRESARLLEAGLLVPAIRYPTVPRQSARLRVTLSASHGPEEIRTLATVLQAGVKN